MSSSITNVAGAVGPPGVVSSTSTGHVESSSRTETSMSSASNASSPSASTRGTAAIATVGTGRDRDVIPAVNTGCEVPTIIILDEAGEA